MRSPELLLVLAIANLPLYLLVIRIAFDSWSDFGTAVLFFIGGRWLQLLDWSRGGDGDEHQWNSAKLFVLVLMLGAAVGSEYHSLVTRFPGSIPWAHQLIHRG